MAVWESKKETKYVFMTVESSYEASQPGPMMWND
jgi:hypothetical protein